MCQKSEIFSSKFTVFFGTDKLSALQKTVNFKLNEHNLAQKCRLHDSEFYFYAVANFNTQLIK